MRGESGPWVRRHCGLEPALDSMLIPFAFIIIITIIFVITIIPIVIMVYSCLTL